MNVTQKGASPRKTVRALLDDALQDIAKLAADIRKQPLRKKAPAMDPKDAVAIQRALGGMVHAAALVLGKELHRAPETLVAPISKALAAQTIGLRKNGFDAALDRACEVVRTRVRQRLA